jgi:serine/threonine protein kinase
VLQKHNFIHSDVKPDNIILNFPHKTLRYDKEDERKAAYLLEADLNNVEVKIIDFGYLIQAKIENGH